MPTGGLQHQRIREYPEQVGGLLPGHTILAVGNSTALVPLDAFHIPHLATGVFDYDVPRLEALDQLDCMLKYLEG
jgi:hypothetical protein